jgi:transcriptional regulator with XRE-family HTH domain
MSPRRLATYSSPAVETAVNRLWANVGQQLRAARVARRWTVDELARRAGVSAGVVYRIEAGLPASTEAGVRLANALGLRLDFSLTDPRQRRRSESSRMVDEVHSAMGEFEVRHLRALQFPTDVDVPYQHYQFAGRADVVAWDVARAALLHIENKTRFPDLQDAAGSYNAKRAYLGDGLAQRLGIRRWSSQTHVIAALWSSEVLHMIRLRTDTFRSICPDPPDTFAGWWAGAPPSVGTTSALIVLDPLAGDRQRRFVGLEEALGARPRHRGYADAAAGLNTEPR